IGYRLSARDHRPRRRRRLAEAEGKPREGRLVEEVLVAGAAPAGAAPAVEEGPFEGAEDRFEFPRRHVVGADPVWFEESSPSAVVDRGEGTRHARVEPAGRSENAAEFEERGRDVRDELENHSGVDCI